MRLPTCLSRPRVPSLGAIIAGLRATPHRRGFSAVVRCASKVELLLHLMWKDFEGGVPPGGIWTGRRHRGRASFRVSLPYPAYKILNVTILKNKTLLPAGVPPTPLAPTPRADIKPPMPPKKYFPMTPIPQWWKIDSWIGHIMDVAIWELKRAQR